jgi:hypothetical protein
MISAGRPKEPEPEANSRKNTVETEHTMTKPMTV